MPVWTFTSGPNAGKKYEGSSAAESCNDGANGTTDAGTRNLALIMRLLRKEKISCGQVKNLKCRRNASVVTTHPQAYLASFELQEVGRGERSHQFIDVPVVSKEVVESGEPVAIPSDIRE
eukprot:CAMPEP_0197470112 /NCGR_PEP_ID=MMETSP1309-20131121/736_1 /TAXON_ID=464262 /ORGANISM="Genus nov. species nov., Strain RCC998" /LENGTH=119 /DNA_ID=CAMNT_0043006685 /DNA_START=33 /DNA_END=389 /DNA_ORIENTATION=-